MAIECNKNQDGFENFSLETQPNQNNPETSGRQLVFSRGLKRQDLLPFLWALNIEVNDQSSFEDVLQAAIEGFNLPPEADETAVLNAVRDLLEQDSEDVGVGPFTQIRMASSLADAIDKEDLTNLLKRYSKAPIFKDILGDGDRNVVSNSSGLSLSYFFTPEFCQAIGLEASRLLLEGVRDCDSGNLGPPDCLEYFLINDLLTSSELLDTLSNFDNDSRYHCQILAELLSLPGIDQKTKTQIMNRLSDTNPFIASANLHVVSDQLPDYDLGQLINEALKHNSSKHAASLVAVYDQLQKSQMRQAVSAFTEPCEQYLSREHSDGLDKDYLWDQKAVKEALSAWPSIDDPKKNQLAQVASERLVSMFCNEDNVSWIGDTCDLDQLLPFYKVNKNPNDGIDLVKRSYIFLGETIQDTDLKQPNHQDMHSFLTGLTEPYLSNPYELKASGKLPISPIQAHVKAFDQASRIPNIRAILVGSQAAELINTFTLTNFNKDNELLDELNKADNFWLYLGALKSYLRAYMSNEDEHSLAVGQKGLAHLFKEQVLKVDSQSVNVNFYIDSIRSIMTDCFIQLARHLDSDNLTSCWSEFLSDDCLLSPRFKTIFYDQLPGLSQELSAEQTDKLILEAKQYFASRAAVLLSPSDFLLLGREDYGYGFGDNYNSKAIRSLQQILTHSSIAEDWPQETQVLMTDLIPRFKDGQVSSSDARALDEYIRLFYQKIVGPSVDSRK